MKLDLRALSRDSMCIYRSFQENPECPICGFKGGTLQELSIHFRRHGSFSDWFHSHNPNYCKKCGNQIVGRIQDTYKVDFCSLSCKQSKEFWTEARYASQKRSIEIMLKASKGKTKNFTPEHRAFLAEKVKKLAPENKKRYALYGHPFKGKKHSEESRKRIKEGMRKKNANSWEGNFTRFQKIIRATLFMSWTKAVMELDGFRCRDCGATGKLSVHHKMGFRDLVLEVLIQHPDRDIANYEDKCFLHDKCLEYGPLLDLENGITLCIVCHRKRHPKKQVA